MNNLIFGFGMQLKIQETQKMVNFKLGLVKNALSQSDCRILKSAIYISLEKYDEIILCHAIMNSRNIRKWFLNF